MSVRERAPLTHQPVDRRRLPGGLRIQSRDIPKAHVVCKDDDHVGVDWGNRGGSRNQEQFDSKGKKLDGDTDPTPGGIHGVDEVDLMGRSLSKADIAPVFPG